MPVDVYGYIYINGDYIMDKKDNYNKDNELDADKIINSADGEDKFSDEIKISDEVKVNETDKGIIRRIKFHLKVKFRMKIMCPLTMTIQLFLMIQKK